MLNKVERFLVWKARLEVEFGVVVRCRAVKKELI